ncbi:hypothetical protein INR77_03685 [Erythrobacter sp. SCSIO 43205]|uniref:RraA family protein n=1 Tax=Erythrobacter sp. SCSIO 43205 TaxID=2779361 RepID=UPI001CA90E64|nr:hypothetical protein [Erythrobacter sp. SCSIO 43205]UAB78826.1 hypothetical protein INR77_03685 [Erythrobacter sp. SCSIO 43205]
MKIVAFIPAKGESTRVPGKNRAILDGEHLFKRKLRQALDCPLISEVCLDSEDETLASLADDLPVTWLKRPVELASNATDGHAMFAWECRQRPDADIYVQLLCTAPFVTADTISRALTALIENPDADSLVGIARDKQYCWAGGKPQYLDAEGRVPNSIDLPDTQTEAMSLYMVRRGKNSAPPTKRFGTSPILFELDRIEQVDIDTPADFAFAETIAAGQRAGEVARFRSMMGVLSSSVLADITKELGIAAVLPAHIRPTTGGRMMGRAKTLQLGEVAPDAPKDAWKGIYDALQSYDFVRQGDVIMVANEVPTRAYFGDLNASLAIRSGAAGAVIDGVTRDTEDVRRLGLPVYARASHCNDIKFEGTLKSMNTPIQIGDVSIANGDVVFADEDGVVVVPQGRWSEVEERAWQVLETEARIRLSAARGDDVQRILSTHGAF